jgi:hypothetical protein
MTELQKVELGEYKRCFVPAAPPSPADERLAERLAAHGGRLHAST